MRQERMWLFFGLGIGYASLSTVPLPEKTKSGFDFNLYAELALYSENWVFDFGGGWFYNNIVSDDSLGVVTRVITRGGFVEVVPRYRLSEDWSLGPVVRGIFSSDTTFSESQANKTGSNILAGARVVYEFPTSNFLLRFGGQALTDLTVSNRQIWIFQVLAQIGFPLGSEKKYEPRPLPTPTPMPVVTQPLAVAGPARIIDDKTIAVNMDERLILFSTARAGIRSPYRERLLEFTRVLASDSDAWGNVRVEGHSDVRGRHAYNVKLSFERASSVAQFMIENGLPNGRVNTKGFGPDQPIDPANNQIAWAKNRRVEIIIGGVKDVKALAEQINRIWPSNAPVPLLVDKPKGPEPKKAAPKKKKAAPKKKPAANKP